MKKNRFFHILALCCAVFTGSTVVAADDFPTRQPIRLVVGTAAGAGPDIIGRLLAEKMAPLLRQTFIVDNRTGAAGTIAAQHVARSAPDGYTVMLGSTSFMVLSAALNPKLPYDPVKDFVSLGQVGGSSIVLLAANDYPASNLTELIASVKRQPEQPQFASWGAGSSGHFCGEVLNKLAGTRMKHLPYKTTSQVMSDIVGNHIKLGFVDPVTAMPFLSSGKVKALALCPAPIAMLPNVQGYRDAGLDFNANFWWGMFAPAGTPAPIAEALSKALESALQDPEVRDRLTALGLSVAYVPGSALKASMAKDIPFWKEIVRSADISLN